MNGEQGHPKGGYNGSPLRRRSETGASGDDRIKKQDQSDIPGTRSCIEAVATKRNIYFLFVMAMCGAIMFIFGLVTTRAEFLSDLPDAGVVLLVGMIDFCLFFPWFTALYFARHLLISVKRLERDVQYLKDKQETIEASSRPYPEGRAGAPSGSGQAGR